MFEYLIIIIALIYAFVGITVVQLVEKHRRKYYRKIGYKIILIITVILFFPIVASLIMKH